MPSPRTFSVYAVEGDEFITPSDAKEMDLPFGEGWESWAVIQNDFNIIMITPKFELASKTCYALNNMEFTI